MYRLILPRESLHGPEGLRLGAAAGSSLDFHDFREYHPGDDLRRLDWGVYARTDREVVRLYREEITPHVDLFLDTSASMRLPGTRKGAALDSLLSTLREAAAAAGCSLGEHGFVSRQTWRENTPRPLSLRIFLSDLLFPSDPAPVLIPLADRAASLHVIQLLAAEEESPPVSGARELIDAETGERLETTLDAPTVAAYRAALAAHRDRWHQACRRLGATLSTLTDTTVLDPPGRLLPLEQAGLLEPT